MLSDRAIKSYQKLYEKEFSIKISYQQAQDESIKLLRLFKLTYRPILKRGGEIENVKNIQSR
jgi:predicted glycosyltransferase